MAAPPMKPTIAAWDRKSIKNPNLIKKNKLTQPQHHHHVSNGGTFMAAVVAHVHNINISGGKS